MCKHRNGYPFIEMLVVIAILSLIIAMLLPAVQSARVAAARADCLSRLRQLTLAHEQHHTAHGSLPPGFVSTAQPRNMPYLGWPARLIPYLEYDPLWGQVQKAFATDPDPLTFYGHAPYAELQSTFVH